MGRDKARLRLGGRSLLGHVRAAAEATGWPVRIIRRDVVERCGPLGGIFTALATSRAEAELFLPCDMPFISSTLLEELAGRLRRGQRAVFTTADGRPGFPFVLRATTLPVVEQQIRSRQYSIHSLAETLGAKLVRVPKRQAIELLNVNTPADWERISRLC
jgi:molybdopterin-guanine dinucleotide biosynthesis protein A